MTLGLRFLNLSDVDRIPHYYHFTTPFFGSSLFDQKNRESIFLSGSHPSKSNDPYLWAPCPKSGKLDQETWKRKFMYSLDSSVLP